jgi:predicted nucleotidyltransferase
MSGGKMFENFVISTNHQKVLSFLAKFSDQEFYEREIARKIGISTGSTNKVLNDLFSDGLLKRRQEGKMYFYIIDKTNPIFKYFKILNNILLILPLVEKLKSLTKKIVLYGSCADGSDTSESDIDLFLISEAREKILKIIGNYSLGKGFEDIKIQPVIQGSIELLRNEKDDKEFLSLVREGIVLWDRPTDESRF